jgi:TIR domain
MATLFFSYSHRDEALRDQLETHLAMLKRQGFITTWHDRRIAAGENFGETISANLERADIVLLLVTPDFIASDYCYEKEMMRTLERHKEDDSGHPAALRLARCSVWRVACLAQGRQGYHAVAEYR